MSRLISDILQAPEPHFRQLVEQWEKLSGQNGIDVRLGLEISHSLERLLQELGMDTYDTTPQELYHALCNRSLHDSQKLAHYLGVENADSPYIMAQKATKFVKRLKLATTVWVVKSSVLKQQLATQPPKKFMKLSGKRSIESVLKRQATGMVLALGRTVESPEWKTKLHTRYKKLRTSDFDERKIDILIVPARQLATLRGNGHSLKHLCAVAWETGDIVVIPPAKRFNGDVLLLVNSILLSVREQRLYSLFFRMVSTSPKFGERVVHILEKGLKTASEELLGSSLSTIHALARSGEPGVIENIGPGFTADDLEVPDVATILSEHVPDFRFWQGRLAGKEAPKGPVSAHISDVIINASANLGYERRIAHHLQAELWDEFSARYLLIEAIARYVLKSDMIV